MKRLKIILIIFLIIVIVLAGLFWYLSSQQDQSGLVNLPPVGDNNINLNTQLPSTPTTPTHTYIPTVSEEDKLKAQLTKMASAFAERFGSYSNQSDFENLEDLMTFMSRSLKSWAENVIHSGRDQINQPTIYYGITTKALKTKVAEFLPASGRAKFQVSTQRHEVVGSSANAKVYYQDIELEMIKEAGVWKVDRAEWL